MAPNWIEISKILLSILLKLINFAAMIKCAVEEIGKNSVKPSIIPNIIAFKIIVISIIWN